MVGRNRGCASTGMPLAATDAHALQALRSGAQWKTRALPHVPEPFMHGYLQRSPGVAELLAMARRLPVEG